MDTGGYFIRAMLHYVYIVCSYNDNTHTLKGKTNHLIEFVGRRNRRSSRQPGPSPLVITVALVLFVLSFTHDPASELRCR